MESEERLLISCCRLGHHGLIFHAKSNQVPSWLELNDVISAASRSTSDCPAGCFCQLRQLALSDVEDVLRVWKTAFTQSSR